MFLRIFANFIFEYYDETKLDSKSVKLLTTFINIIIESAIVKFLPRLQKKIHTSPLSLSLIYFQEQLFPVPYSKNKENENIYEYKRFAIKKLKDTFNLVVFLIVDQIGKNLICKTYLQ